MKAERQYKESNNRIIQSRSNTKTVFIDNRQGGQRKIMQCFLAGYIPGNTNGLYAGLGNNLATCGGSFSSQQKNEILFQNKAAGPTPVNVSYHDDQTGLPLGSFFEVAVADHIYPASLGGINAYANAQIISGSTNSSIRNTYPKHGYTGSRLYVGHNWFGYINGKRQSIAQGSIFTINGSGATATVNTPGGAIPITVLQTALLAPPNDPL